MCENEGIWIAVNIFDGYELDVKQVCQHMGF